MRLNGSRVSVKSKGQGLGLRVNLNFFLYIGQCHMQSSDKGQQEKSSIELLFYLVFLFLAN